MMIELVGGPRDGEWIDTQGLPSWDVSEFPAMRGSTEEGTDIGKYVRTDRVNDGRIVFEYKVGGMRVESNICDESGKWGTKIKFKHYTCDVLFMPYQDNGRPAIILFDAFDGEQITTASVNLPDEPIEDGYIFIKNWSENDGILEVLEEAGIVKRTGRMVPTGFVEAHECKILDKDVCEKFWP